ncbi:MAG TPA: DUF3604 domain-containing protein [Terriglobia bacterium]|nr:DUF3604 domain-containing protein [Terriglobia bacterium]
MPTELSRGFRAAAPRPRFLPRCGRFDGRDFRRNGLPVRILAVAAIVVLACVATTAQQTPLLLWGDTHLHTSHSTDAYAGGNTTLGPAEAYRFARGEPVVHPITGERVRITRPLDFLVVADHSDYLGLQKYMQMDDPRLTATPEGRRLRQLAIQDPAGVFRMIFGNNPEFSRDQLVSIFAPIARQPWHDEIDAAERYNEPGVFTAFAGWEWSSHANNRNLHRVVFTPAGPDALRSFFPYSNLDSVRPEDLWAWLETTSKRTGAEFVAIPHNSNMSTGLMFDMVDSNGRPITAEYARTRMRWEPVMEVTQAKGTSEVHPALSPNDEFAEFEIFRRLFFAQEPVPDGGDYARSALLRGLEIASKVGVNPYRLGMIGSSDIHTGMSTTEENSFGGAVARDIRPETRRDAAARPYPPNAAARLDAWNLSASGLAAVWAAENSRQAITRAFLRKEVYATTGTRIALRVFGGFKFKASDAEARDIAAVGYSGGVPMGGDLAHAPGGAAPTLLIHAVKDPSGANLDRVQVVKGWIDSAGKTHDRVYDVVWSGNRTKDSNGKLPAVGNTVDLARASYKNTIGAAQLSTVWKDPDFDPSAASFYYIRVLEIPTPRHQVYDAVALGMDPKATGYATTIQERAYSTPIWYIP